VRGLLKQIISFLMKQELSIIRINSIDINKSKKGKNENKFKSLRKSYMLRIQALYGNQTILTAKINVCLMLCLLPGLYSYGLVNNLSLMNTLFIFFPFPAQNISFSLCCVSMVFSSIFYFIFLLFSTVFQTHHKLLIFSPPHFHHHQ